MDKYKTVDKFLSGLDEDRKAQVEKLRQYILEAAPSLKENIKWNAPNYVQGNEDRITFNTLNKERVVKLVLHMGATKKEDKKGQPVLPNAPLIEWASDIRGYMSFSNLEEILSNEREIKRTIHDWLALT